MTDLIAKLRRCGIDDAADEIERLTAENAALREKIANWEYSAKYDDVHVAALSKDAERYRWLRDKKHPSLGLTRLVLNDTPHGIDAAIDAFLAATAPKERER